MDIEKEEAIWRPYFFESGKKRIIFWLFILVLSLVLAFLFTPFVYIFFLFLSLTFLQFVGFLFPPVKLFEKGIWLREKRRVVDWNDIEKINLIYSGVRFNESQMYKVEVVCKEHSFKVVLDSGNIKKFQEAVEKLGFGGKLQKA